MRPGHWLSFFLAHLIVAAPVYAGTGAREAAHHRPTTPIDESRYITIGGIRQWVTISGSNQSNPVVLFLHGGPGNPLSPYSRSLYGKWANDFTIVQWDQRGAGRTFEANPESANAQLTIRGMSQDGIQVAEYIRQYLGKRKVLLIGGSWGSALGVHMIADRPDLFHAYVGVGQLVNEVSNQAASLRRINGLAAAANDQATINSITALGPPPWRDPRSFGKLRRLTRTYESKVVVPAPVSWWVRDPAYKSSSYERAYEAGEEYSYLQFVGATGGGLLSTINLSKLGTKFSLPIYLVQGSEDLVTTADVSRAWFDSINAPLKQYVLVPRAGHDPNPPLLDAIYAILKAVPLNRGLRNSPRRVR